MANHVELREENIDYKTMDNYQICLDESMVIIMTQILFEYTKAKNIWKSEFENKRI